MKQEEKQRGKQSEDVWPAANLLAWLRACAETYNHFPDEDELKAQETELSRKYELFYAFTQQLHIDANLSHLLDGAE